MARRCRLTRESLQYYILTLLDFQDMYGEQILESVTSTVQIAQPTLYNMLDELAAEGKITKTPMAYNGTSINLCRITSFGKSYLKSFIQTR